MQVMDPAVHVLEDEAALARAGADLVGSLIAADPASSIVVATGRTPMGLYARLASDHAAGALDTSQLRVVQLDDYLGLEPDSDRSLFAWMARSFLDPLGIPPERVSRLPLVGDLEAGCAAFDRSVDAGGGIDLAILGIGTNGHLGFNEPPSDATSPTRAVELSPSTLEANARYWGEGVAVPRHAVTVGLAQLLRARRIVLVASGSGKRDIVERALRGPITPEVPASHLRLAPDVTVLLDRAAAPGEGSA
jgi:glucosamine-6-phosphate deaminase